MNFDFLSKTKKCNFLILLFSLFFISCDCTLNSSKVNVVNKVSDSLIKVNLRYDDLLGYTSKEDSSNLNNDYFFTIISYINASCSSCLAEIDKWNIFSKEISQKVRILLIFYSNDNFEYLKSVLESEKLNNSQIEIYFDQENQFLKNNPLFTNHNFENTILMDVNDRILLTGNPLHAIETKNSYLANIGKRK